MRSPAGRVVLLALASRIAVISAMSLAGWAFPDLDSSARLQGRPCAAAGAGDGTPGSAASPLSGLAVWDTAYFARVARCGYESDKLNAFFPLLPAAMAGLARASGVARMLPPEAAHALAGLALNVAAFCAAALCLQRLGRRVLARGSATAAAEGRRTADLAALIFCCGPASVFYSTAYTEALFAACTWAGLLLLPTRHWAGVAALAAAAAARSNGVLGVWFPLHALAAATHAAGRLPLALAARTALGCVAIVAPYFAMQARAYFEYCVPSGGPEGGGAAPAPPWCNAWPPSIYGFVQREYWDVGLLRFYRDPARLPMVLMSLPVAWLSVGGCWAYFAADWRRALTLGLLTRRAAPPAWLAAAERSARRVAAWPWRRLGAALPPGGQSRGRGTARGGGGGLEASREAAPLVYHWALMTAVALLAMHVNVATRFLSACPPLYWHAARWAAGGGARARLLWLWCLAYVALGCLMFPNAYPWT